jgi:hypothetical protein
MQCAELCGVELGPRLYEKLRTELSACRKRRPESINICETELSERPDMVAEAKRITDRCLLDCGFPDLEAMTP